MIECSNLPSRVQLIIRQCASEFAIRPEQLLGRGRRKTVTGARAMAVSRLRDIGKSYKEIGRYLGIHHSAAMYHVNGKKKPDERPIQGPCFIPDYSGEWAI